MSFDNLEDIYDESLILSELHNSNYSDKPDGKHCTMDINFDTNLIKEHDLSLIFPKSISLNFTLGTELNLVGEQLWTAAPFLAEYIAFNHSLFKNENVIELGCGIGLIGLMLTYVGARCVYCTDYNNEILNLCQKNLLDQTGKEFSKKIKFKRIDWTENIFDMPVLEYQDPYYLDKEELSKICKVTKYFFAADVVYDFELTKAFLSTILKLVEVSERDGAALFLTIEKRINFSLEKLKIVAEAYDELFELLNQEPYCNKLYWERLPSTFPKFIKNYERTEQLEIWMITLKNKN